MSFHGGNYPYTAEKSIKRLHCRLNLLKRKRHSIVRQLREDIAQLLKIGQNEAAFARVEQLLKDRSLLDAYDLVDHYCEFIILHFPYIRRHKDRPKDINEAVSTLIFAAAWFGDLPELRAIRKLFGKRYGQKFIKDVAALQSGNLVNHEIMEKLRLKLISDSVKLKLINEIAMDYGLQLWYFGSDNRPKQHLLQMPGDTDHQLERFVFEEDAGVSYNSTSGAIVLASYAKHSPDIPSELTIHPPDKAPMHKKAVHTENHSQYKYMYELPDQSDFGSSGSNNMSADSFKGIADIARTATREISFQYHKRTVYVDEVEEFEFNGKDKSLFLFNASPRPLIDNYGVDGSTLLALSHHGYSEGNCNGPEPEDKITLSRKTHKRIRNSYGHRLERRVDTKTNRKCESFLTPVNKKDNDCVVFNGQFCNFSPCQKQFYHRVFHFQNKQRTTMPAKERRIASLVCYDKVSSKPVKGYVQSCKSPEKKFRCCLEKSCYKCDGQVNGTQTQDNKKLMETEESSDCPARYASSYNSSSQGPSPGSRKKTIPPKRLKGMTVPDNDNQSISSHLELSKGSTASSCSHVHPKLPDYDEIAAKFIALKKEHQLRTNAARHGLNIA
ncbi:PREDICTED: uncharacterized protein LOC105128115 [Populus euphratica]|uniref:Uncharacterized protein LOC105128115 n=1 Tax=Populus euphratica TaxID=75702 RepID=A0AAJ6UEI9_POPEU|nr:PREDICTED: uncharacterized protein LOC105128115 [Populus euphratica]